MAKANPKIGSTAKTSNGVTSKTAEAAVPATRDELAGIVISGDERTQLAALEAEAVRFKIALADADMQIARAEAERQEIRQKVAASSKLYVDAVLAAASAHGIDLNDQSVRWNFDTQKMTFTRHG